MLLRVDNTLEAIDAQIENEAGKSSPRSYIGMSSIGHSCERNIYYSFRWAKKPHFNASTLKKFEDGHKGEDLQAERFRLLADQGVDLVTHINGSQIGFSDLGGHFRGHMDGQISGLLDCPGVDHVWEHKQVADKKQAELIHAISKHGEENALKVWNQTYYAQACLYMFYSGLNSHYLTVSTAGGRDTISVFTPPDHEFAQTQIRKAENVLNANQPPPRMRNASPSYFECRWCNFKDLCFGSAQPDQNCRTCVNAEPVNGGWKCARNNTEISTSKQSTGCDLWTICL